MYRKWYVSSAFDGLGAAYCTRNLLGKSLLYEIITNLDATCSVAHRYEEQRNPYDSIGSS